MIIGNFGEIAKAICMGVMKIYGLKYKEKSVLSRGQIIQSIKKDLDLLK